MNKRASQPWLIHTGGAGEWRRSDRTTSRHLWPRVSSGTPTTPRLPARPPARPYSLSSSPFGSPQLLLAPEPSSPSHGWSFLPATRRLPGRRGVPLGALSCPFLLLFYNPILVFLFLVGVWSSWRSPGGGGGDGDAGREVLRGVRSRAPRESCLPRQEVRGGELSRLELRLWVLLPILVLMWERDGCGRCDLSQNLRWTDLGWWGAEHL